MKVITNKDLWIELVDLGLNHRSVNEGDHELNFDEPVKFYVVSITLQ